MKYVVSNLLKNVVSDIIKYVACIFCSFLDNLQGVFCIN
jgi:hypothetical protein